MGRGAMGGSQKSPGVSRQGTLRSSHRRKNSMSASLNLGRRSPGSLQTTTSIQTQDQKSPQGRKSPLFLGQDQANTTGGHRSPTDRRSPTSSSVLQAGRRSPLTLHYGMDPGDHRKSPTQLDRRSPITPIMEDRQFTMEPTPLPSLHCPSSGRRSPIGFSQGMMTTITPTKSPTVPFIPPITISKPSETMAFVQKMQMDDMNRIDRDTEITVPETEKPTPNPQPSPNAERKEKSSVMKDILAFVRKPSSKKSPSPTPPPEKGGSSGSPSGGGSTRTSRFAAAFSRTESNSGIPLLRQSTFSSSPTPSSRAAKSAVTKQLSEVSLEPKMSSRFRSLASSTKISLRLRRSAAGSEKKDKKSSGDDLSDADSASESRSAKSNKKSVSVDKEAFDMDTVKFDKVGDGFGKHDKIREETLEESSSSAKSPHTPSDLLLDIGSSHPVAKKSKTSDDEINSNNIRVSVENLKRSLQNLLGGHSHKGDDQQQSRGNKEERHKDTNGNVKGQNTESNKGDDGAEGAEGATGMDTLKCTGGIQCPTFEIEPPSRRASFDPPRSPYLESLRSPADTDTTRFDSGGDSFEIVDTDRNRESSFEDRYSSMDTSFDISRYHSTSYEDQTSSFEMVEGAAQNRSIDLRKSSIELVDVETFQQRGPAAGGGDTSRKSSLETHFDYMKPSGGGGGGGNGDARMRNGTGRHYLKHSSGSRGKSAMLRSHFRPRSPLSQQTSSNYSSRDSYDSGSDYYAGSSSRSPFLGHSHCQQQHLPSRSAESSQRSPYESKQHFPMPPKSPNEPAKGFICTDTRCAAIFEPRPTRTASPAAYLSCSSGNEFEPPSPRRASSASPKHTFTFRIVMKKMESSPDNIGAVAKDRKSRHKRKDSRRKRMLSDAGSGGGA